MDAEIKGSLERQVLVLQETLKDRDEEIQMIKTERDELVSEITKLFSKFEKSNELIGNKDTFIQQLNTVIN